jgi:hypothetical protein
MRLIVLPSKRNCMRRKLQAGRTAYALGTKGKLPERKATAQEQSLARQWHTNPSDPTLSSSTSSKFVIAENDVMVPRELFHVMLDSLRTGIGLAGTPATAVPCSTFRMTTAPARVRLPIFIVTPGPIKLWAPTQQLSSTTIGFVISEKISFEKSCDPVHKNDR